MATHFLSFASQAFIKSLNRIQKEAFNTGFFDTITCIKSSDLPLNYRFKHWTILNRFTRGYGYWIWKSFIIKNKLGSISDGDILVYVDAGCVLNKEGKTRFEEYLHLVCSSEYSNLSFQTVHMEKKYTKGDVFKYFNVQNDVSITNSDQLMATVFIIKKTPLTSALVNEWYYICHERKNLINDTPSVYPNDPFFIDHRHDQSVFSVLRKLRGTVYVPDETFFNDWDNYVKFPFHAKRLRQ